MPLAAKEKQNVFTKKKKREAKCCPLSSESENTVCSRHKRYILCAVEDYSLFTRTTSACHRRQPLPTPFWLGFLGQTKYRFSRVPICCGPPPFSQPHQSLCGCLPRFFFYGFPLWSSAFWYTLLTRTPLSLSPSPGVNSDPLPHAFHAATREFIAWYFLIVLYFFLFFFCLFFM